jgi:hypothetical protein
MGHPGDITSAPSFTGLMRIKPCKQAHHAPDARHPLDACKESLVSRLFHRYRMASVFLELLFSDVRGTGKRSR